MKKKSREPGTLETMAMNYQGLSGRLLLSVGKVRCGVLLFLALVILTACGGGGDSLASGGIGGTGTISVGPVTDFGSIFVNGIEFDISKATIQLNGVASSESMLRIGMVVKVEGTVNGDGITGTATSVLSEDNVQGPISAVDPGSGTITVLGQNILTDAATVFDTPDPLLGVAGLATDDTIEVSGLPSADGSIHATMIRQLASGGGEVQVTGPASNVQGNTFMINALNVDVSPIMPGMGMMPPTDGNPPQNGDVVAVTGYLDNNGVLIAGGMRMMPALPAGNSQMQLTGYIQTTTADSFTLRASMMGGLVTVMIDQNTIFTAGSAVDLQPGVLVAVKGGMTMATMGAQEISVTQ